MSREINPSRDSIGQQLTLVPKEQQMDRVPSIELPEHKEEKTLSDDTKKTKKEKKKKKKKHRSKEREKRESEEKVINVVDKLNDVNLPPNIIIQTPEDDETFFTQSSTYQASEQPESLYENVRAVSRTSSAPAKSDRKSPENNRKLKDKDVDDHQRSKSPQAKRHRNSHSRDRLSRNDQKQSSDKRLSKQWQYDDSSDDQNVSYSLHPRVNRQRSSYGHTDMDSSDSDGTVRSSLRRRLSQNKKRAISDSD